jgi:hypothetical protein
MIKNYTHDWLLLAAAYHASPPLLSIRLARAEREGRRPTTGIAGSPRLLQGSLLDYMPNICAPPAGSGWLSPAGALAVTCTLTNRRRPHGVSSNEVVCHGVLPAPERMDVVDASDDEGAEAEAEDAYVVWL